jgi:4-carboxymuconolactone decarboxylase
MTLSDLPKPPKTHDEFVEAFPELARAWEIVGAAGKEGPLDDKTTRIVKLAVAMGAQHEGAVHASVRKALAMGITREELQQVVALAAGTLGFPQTVAAYTWVKDLL